MSRRVQTCAVALRRYAPFFLLVSFLTTCSMLLFLNTISTEMGVVFREEGIQRAAKLTFGNVLFLSLLLTLFDVVRRKLTVERWVKRINAVAQQVMQGDFSVRIEPVRGLDADGFGVVANYVNRMIQELSGIETLRADFIANVSHELKTPLAVVQNYGVMLQQPGLSEDQRLEYAKAITSASRRLADLITNILRLNKLENQHIHPMNETLNLGEELCACLLAFEDLWEQKGLELKTDLEEDVWVKGDRELLCLVWNNLLSNAMKFTPEGGTVGVSLQTEGTDAVVQVWDTGCGISREAGAHIFEKFYQGDTSHAVQGNGLGLALVRRVVDIVGGEISVESETGRGSLFTVKLRGVRHELETDR